MNNELLTEFLFDSREHLTTAGAQLLELEKTPDSLAALNALMGTLHTIKGNSGFLDLPNLYKLMHHAESLLQTVREKQCDCSRKIIDLLLQVLDTVEALLTRLEDGDDDNAEWLQALNQALSEAEADFDDPAAGGIAAPASSMAAAGNSPAPQALPQRVANLLPPAKINEDFLGKISLLSLKDYQISEENDQFPARIAAMFEAGLKGLIIDLKAITAISSHELRLLMTAGRQHSDRTVFLLDAASQVSLMRIFQILQLDNLLRFFPDEQSARTYIESGS